jgi:hypothetical protein
MTSANKKTEQPAKTWFIDLKWYEQNNRSFTNLAKDALCAKCRKRFTGKHKEASPDDLIKTISECCASQPDFITNHQPILTSIFRLFLANKNEPLDLTSLSKLLDEKRGGDVSRSSVSVLSRLLKDENYYGIRQAESP